MSEIELSRNAEVPAFRELVPGVTSVDVSPRLGGVQVSVTFVNGFGASVIRGYGTYGGDAGLWELAVIGPDGDLDHSTPVADDVIGWLDDDAVLEKLREISALTPDGVAQHQRRIAVDEFTDRLMTLLNDAQAAGIWITQAADDEDWFNIVDAEHPGPFVGNGLVRTDGGRWKVEE